MGVRGAPVRRAAFAVWLTLMLTPPVGAQPSRGDTPTVRATQLRPDVYMLSGSWGNAALQVGPDGALLVDTGTATEAGALVAAVRRITDTPIRLILNTSASADRVGGNEVVSKAGRALVAQGGPGFGGVYEGATILAHENVLARMGRAEAGRAAYPAAAWPFLTFPNDYYNLFFNGEGIQVLHHPAAHSDGDTIVFFRRSDLVVAGHLVDVRRFPVIDRARGGNVQGVIDGLNALVKLMIPPVPLPWQQGGTLLVPARGWVAEQAEVVEYRDMVTVVRDRVRSMVETRMTRAQIHNANPTQGYRARYGADSGDWTTAAFVDAVIDSVRPSGGAR